VVFHFTKGKIKIQIKLANGKLETIYTKKEIKKKIEMEIEIEIEILDCSRENVSKQIKPRISVEKVYSFYTHTHT